MNSLCSWVNTLHREEGIGRSKYTFVQIFMFDGHF